MPLAVLRDFSRIAASDPHMWHDIFFANKKGNFEDAMNGFEKQLAILRKLIGKWKTHKR